MKPEVEYTGFMKQQSVEYGRVFRRLNIPKNSEQAIVFIHKNGDKMRKFTESKLSKKQL